jgi:uncharacterized protein involved in exopolysaccharide biosynthesis
MGPYRGVGGDDRPVSASVTNLDLDESIDLRAIIACLWLRRWWIMASILLCGSLFVAVAFVMTPIYRATTVFVPASVGRPGGGNLLGGALGSLGDLASLAGVNIGGGANEAEEGLAVLRSRQFTEAFIRDENLMPKLFPNKWDAPRQQWKSDVVPPTPGQAYKYFNTAIRSILQDKKTGLITMQIDWRDRLDATRWANELMVRLNAEMRARAIAKADASVGYLEEELNKTSVVGTRDAISRLMEAQIRQRMIANVTQEYAFRVVDAAIAPDNKDVLKPKKAVILASGLALGLFLSVVAVLSIDGVGRDPVASRARA